MDILTFSQVLFNTLASALILLFAAVLCLIIYYIVKIANWVHQIEKNVSESSQKISNFFTAAKDALIVPIMAQFFPRAKKRKKE